MPAGSPCPFENLLPYFYCRKAYTHLPRFATNLGETQQYTRPPRVKRRSEVLGNQRSVCAECNRTHTLLHSIAGAFVDRLELDALLLAPSDVARFVQQDVAKAVDQVALFLHRFFGRIFVRDVTFPFSISEIFHLAHEDIVIPATAPDG